VTTSLLVTTAVQSLAQFSLSGRPGKSKFVDVWMRCIVLGCALLDHVDEFWKVTVSVSP